MDRRNHISKLVKQFAVSILLLSVILALSACDVQPVDNKQSHALGDTGISVYPEMVKVDLEYGSKMLGFPLYFVSDRQLPEDAITFVRLEGENTTYFETTLDRHHITDVTDVEINGSYLYVYNVLSNIDIDYFSNPIDVDSDHSTPTESAGPPEIWEIRVDTVVVRIDGNEYSIDLEYPAEYHYHYNIGGYNDLKGNHMYGPIAIYTYYGLTEAYSTNIYNYSNAITLKDFYFSKYLNAENKQVYYQGRLLGDLSGTQAYSVEQREKEASSGATVYYNPAFSESFDHSDFDYILCTSVLEYQIEGDDTVYKMKFPFNAQGIGDRETAEAFLSYVASLE